MRLAALVPVARDGQEPLGCAIAEAVLSPGKRLRPLMTAIVTEDLGGARRAGIDAGCAVEMVHAASLILDDLPSMDNAELRRGRPTTHRAHGEDVAILAAIGALSGAYGVLAGIEDLDPAARSASVALLAEAVGPNGLVAGQYHDLRGGRRNRHMAEIAQANGLKTGALFVAAVAIGAAVAGASERTRTELVAFADELGHAFQLLDDLLDARASSDTLGKDVGKDAGKSTIVALIGVAPTERHIERHLENAHMRLHTVFGPSSRMAAIVDRVFAPHLPARQSGGRTRIEQEAGVH